MESRSHALPKPRPPAAWAAYLLVLTALFPRLGALQHGFPYGYERDADWPHAALVMLRDHDPAPPRYAHTAEPYLCAYLTAPIFAARYVLGKARGEWRDADGFGAHLVAHPEEEVLAGRLVAALFGALAPLLLLTLLRGAGVGRGAYVAALLLALDPFHVSVSVQARTLAPFLTLLLGAALAASRYMTSGRTRTLFGATVLAALAHAAREVPTGAVVLGLPGLAWFFGPLRWRGKDLRRRAALALGCATLFVAVSVPLGYPFLLAHPREPIAGKLMGLWLGALSSFVAQGELLFAARGFLHTIDGRSLGVLLPAFLMNTPVLAGLAIVGIAPTFLRTTLRRALAPVTLFALLWGLVYLTHRNGHVADAAPLLVLAAPAAGAALELILRWRMFAALVFLGLAGAAATTAKVVYILRQPDTRALADAWLSTEPVLPPGSVVALDAFGPRPLPSLASLERTARLRAPLVGSEDPLNGRERARLTALRAGLAKVAGVDVMYVEDVLRLDYWDGPLAGLACRDGRRRAAWVHSTGSPGDYVAWSAGVRHEFLWPGERYRARATADTALATSPVGARSSATSSALVRAREGQGALRAAGATHVLLCHFGRSGEEPHVLAMGLPPPLVVFDPGGAGDLEGSGERRLPFDLETGWFGIWQAQHAGPRVEVRAL
ncbi:MAG: glycosyltransferase family 39 protein [Planctomycetota bacterium]